MEQREIHMQASGQKAVCGAPLQAITMRAGEFPIFVMCPACLKKPQQLTMTEIMETVPAGSGVPQFLRTLSELGYKIVKEDEEHI